MLLLYAARIEAQGQTSIGILDLRSPAGPPLTIVTSQGGASVKPYWAATARPAGRFDRRQNA